MIGQRSKEARQASLYAMFDERRRRRLEREEEAFKGAPGEAWGSMNIDLPVTPCLSCCWHVAAYLWSLYTRPELTSKSGPDISRLS